MAYCQRKRAAIFEVLGRKCAKCRATTDLEFDVIVPVGGPKSHHGKLSWCARMAFYCRQLAAGNLQVLCGRCNGAKNDNVERYIVPLARKELEIHEQPF